MSNSLLYHGFGIHGYQYVRTCVSLMKMSPLTAVLKCPHYGKGYFKHESEGEAEVPSFTDGFRW